MGKLAQRLAAHALCLVVLATQAVAAPPAGTVVSNQASGSADIGGTPFARPSNVVSFSTSASVPGMQGGTLVSGSTLRAAPGATVFFPHTLTNTGTLPDSYTLSITNLPGTFDFTGVAIFADANGDGLPDSATPVAAPVVLLPGQAFRFVVRGIVPATAPNDGYDRLQVNASGALAVGIFSNIDTAAIFVDGPPPPPQDGLSIFKAFSVGEGPSPYESITVTIRYSNSNMATSDKRDFTIMDRLNPGLVYVPGSARWSGAGAPLTDAAAGDPAGISYDFNATTNGSVVAVIAQLGAGDKGEITFRANVAPGLRLDEVVSNIAQYRWKDTQGADRAWADTNTVTYRVTGTIDLTLTGETIPEATPGSSITFTNVLTNRGTIGESFDIALAASTFPAGTAFTLFQPDGITALRDTNGNGIPDTGIVAPGATYRIIVRATLPSTTAPGSYRVTKTATSFVAPSRRAVADDIVASVSLRCRVVFEPDNVGAVPAGTSIVYSHSLRNLGNCTEDVSFPNSAAAAASKTTDSMAGWTSAAFLDNPVAGPESTVGQLDTGDTAISPATRITLAPGAERTVLVRVTAPTAISPQQNVTRTDAAASQTGALAVNDRTTNDKDGIEVDNVLRNFTSSTYQVSTIWAVIGRDLYLRADAQACNALPDIVETRTIVITGANGEREEVTATETGPNTGIFVATTLPVRRPPVTPGNAVVEGVSYDVMMAEVIGCGRRIATQITLIEPSGIVFDSKTNAPVSGAVVRLVVASGNQCSATLATVTTISAGNVVASANPVTTKADGRFEFPLVAAGAYCISVTTPNGYTWVSKVPYDKLPGGRNLVVTGPTSGGSYGNPFSLASAGPIVLDSPADPGALSGLFVQKSASRAVVELGEFVDYAVRVKNGTGRALSSDVLVVDDLPAGFAYVAGTARRGAGTVMVDPEGKQGPRLSFHLGAMAAGEEVLLTYRVRVGPGAMQGDGTNRVRAFYSTPGFMTESNLATAFVQVTGGVFSDQGYILGRVFADCNANGLQDKGEPGVPGVRLYLEDGTNVVTDGEGKYSLYGIKNRTHVMKVDRTTLPAGARLAAIEGRHAGDGGSRFVDLKAGELHRADFAISNCADVDAEVRARREAFSRSEISADGLVSRKLLVDRETVIDVKSQPASGVLGQAAGTGNPAIATEGVAFVPVEPQPAKSFEKAPVLGMVVARAPAIDLEKLVPDLDSKLGFVGLKDGDTLAYAQTTIRVKGQMGATFKLLVNGEEVSPKRVGKKSVLESRQVQAWEYVGIDLKPGTNFIQVVQVDGFGNERGRESLSLVAPDKLGRIAIELPAGGGVADGRTDARIVVKLTDAAGVPVTVRTPVTLESTRGQWRAEDLDKMEPGVQVFVEGGRGEFKLSSPIEPGEAIVRVTSGPLKAEAKLDFLPDLRQIIAVGVIEGAISLRNLNTNALQPARAQDAFEQELKRFSRTSNDGKMEAGARAAFFLKGVVKGEYLLTAAFDSEKETRERLFRDIQPDEFYPVYGDASQRGFDAQSTARLYVRIDHRKSYLLYGDYTTQVISEARKLGTYSRSLTGVREHYENKFMSANVFASKDSTRQAIDEIRANGTSGPYTLTSAAGLVNSEKVEILTRNRNQPSIIIQAVPQMRFFDYEIEPLTGRILFKAPVPSVDANLNPNSIRVTYEVDQGGPQFWVAGGDVQVKVHERVELGATYVKDKNPADPLELKGVNATVKLADKTFIFAEVAQTDRELTSGKGNASRVELKHDGERLQVQAGIAHTDKEFDNPGAYLSKGRGESGAKAAYKIDDKTIVRAEALRTEDVTTNAVRDGASVSVERRFDNNIAVEVGVRHAREANGPAIPTGTLGVPSAGVVPDHVTTARAKVSGPVPGIEGAAVYGEAEVDVENTDRKILALGGEYTLPNKGKAYLRHEFISSITGPYGLNEKERQNTSVFGVDTEYMKDGRLFSEYRIRDALSGGDAEAAIGLRNTWTIAEGWKVGTNIEKVHAFSGTGQNENTALAVGLEYTANPAWKGTTRIELRDAPTTESMLHTIGAAAKLSGNWTLLGRNTLSIQRKKEGDGEQVLERMQAGLAFRDTQTNKWDALGRIEYREEKDNLTPGIELKRSTELVSINANLKLNRPFMLSGRYAAKWTTENSSGITSRYRAQLVGGRLTWEFAPKWDAGIVASLLVGDSTSSRQYGIGLEVGYLVTTNLWVSAGYNFFGYRDDDLAGTDHTAKGPYVRLRYKFDEQLFEKAANR